ncbi:MAG TPA: hypothetical protein VJJ76_00600 [archaeon]|nr:hypothetical protein [archaeon]
MIGLLATTVRRIYKSLVFNYQCPGEKDMNELKEIASVHATLIKDRNVLKWRVNLVRDGKIYGFLKPV